MKAISACLAGVKCRYNNTDVVSDLDLSDDNYLLICPEVFGLLPTPRNAVEIVGEIKNNTYDDLVNKNIKVLDIYGEDYSQHFINGANRVLKLLKNHNIKEVILKSKSPSCGISEIYDGTFTNSLIKNDGVLAALLKKEGYLLKSK